MCEIEPRRETWKVNRKDRKEGERDVQDTDADGCIDEETDEQDERHTKMNSINRKNTVLALIFST